MVGMRTRQAKTSAGTHESVKLSRMAGRRPATVSLRLPTTGLTSNRSADKKTCDHAAAAWASSEPA
jgi:hypothetical protein